MIERPLIHLVLYVYTSTTINILTKLMSLQDQYTAWSGNMRLVSHLSQPLCIIGE